MPPAPLRRERPAPGVLAAAVALTLVPAGCSGDAPDVEGAEPTSPDVSQSTVAPPDVVAQARRAFDGTVPDDATLACPDPLPAQEQATTRCTWTLPDEGTMGMTVTVTAVEGGSARLHFANDDAVEETTP